MQDAAGILGLDIAAARRYLKNAGARFRKKGKVVRLASLPTPIADQFYRWLKQRQKVLEASAEVATT